MTGGRVVGGGLVWAGYLVALLAGLGFALVGSVWPAVGVALQVSAGLVWTGAVWAAVARDERERGRWGGGG